MKSFVKNLLIGSTPGLVLSGALLAADSTTQPATQPTTQPSTQPATQPATQPTPVPMPPMEAVDGVRR